MEYLCSICTEGNVVRDEDNNNEASLVMSIIRLQDSFFLTKKKIFFLSDTFTCPILGPLVPLFWISGDVSSGFQSQHSLKENSVIKAVAYPEGARGPITPPPSACKK